MWQCPTCKREFKQENQSHYCGKAETVEAYIELQSSAVQPLLREIRETIRVAAPGATEKMSWQMPTFWQGENLIHFAAHKKHISIYPGEAAAVFFAERLKEYTVAKGTIQLPLDRPLDLDLIADIVRWRVAQTMR